MSFPKNFVWGAASASYQIEGAAYEDGKGLSIWDVFCRKNGAVANKESGDVACDHYHRYAEDIGLMKTMGLQAYRLSISWPRVLPGGTGAVNAEGLSFYDRLVDELLDAGIDPYVTLFHWDYPYDLYCKGGWLNRDSASWFGEYTGVIARALGDRVKNWITINEPQVFVGLGHGNGLHAPGVKLSLREQLQVIHNVHRSHGEAVRVLRTESKTACAIGIAPAASVKVPASNTAADIEAARSAIFTVKEKTHWNMSWWLDPLYLGCYPAEGVALMRDEMPPGFEQDMTGIAEPLDFIGLNIYFADRIGDAGKGKNKTVPFSAGYPRTAFRWVVIPEALYWIPLFVWERYNSAVFITENGLSNEDWVSLDGKVHDPQRIDFVSRYLSEFRRSAKAGVDIRGYFYWSILDNFEWAEGYKERFGLVYVDYQNQNRILKDSAHWYRECIAANGETIPEGNMRFS